MSGSLENAVESMNAHSDVFLVFVHTQKPVSRNPKEPIQLSYFIFRCSRPILRAPGLHLRWVSGLRLEKFSCSLVEAKNDSHGTSVTAGSSGVTERAAVVGAGGSSVGGEVYDSFSE